MKRTLFSILMDHKNIEKFGILLWRHLSNSVRSNKIIFESLIIFFFPIILDQIKHWYTVMLNIDSRGNNEKIPKDKKKSCDLRNFSVLPVSGLTYYLIMKAFIVCWKNWISDRWCRIDEEFYNGSRYTFIEVWVKPDGSSPSNSIEERLGGVESPHKGDPGEPFEIAAGWDPGLVNYDWRCLLL